MVVPLDARPRYQSNPDLSFPIRLEDLKKHLAMAAAREFGLMPNCALGHRTSMVEWFRLEKKGLSFLRTLLRLGLGDPCIFFS